MSGSDKIVSLFRLDPAYHLDRATALLRDAQDGDRAAQARILTGHTPKYHPPKDQSGCDGASLALADAQDAIARELGLADWAGLTAHSMAMQAEENRTDPLDQAQRTVHIRCGSDIAGRLHQAGFCGDFLEYSNPFCLGPVTDDPGLPKQIAARAGFLANNLSGIPLYSEADITRKLQLEEAGLSAAVRDYERIVLWFEHDSYDQLILARCLAWLHDQRPRTVELISINHFPGTARFIGLGQLPGAALRLIWQARQPVTEAEFRFGKNVWAEVMSPDPTGLARLVQGPDRLLPDMKNALRRHLQELPSTRTGLSLTEQLILEMLTEGSQSLGTLYNRLTNEREPLPWLTDLLFAHVVGTLCTAGSPAIAAEQVEGTGRYGDLLTLTATGQQVLDGSLNWLDCSPPTRWVGGVAIDCGRGRPSAGWYWDEATQAPVQA